MKVPTILVVEDNPIAAKMVRLALETAGYAVVCAEDGRSALKWVREEAPDLVLKQLHDEGRLASDLRVMPDLRDEDGAAWV